MNNKKTYEKAIEELSLMLMYLTRTQDEKESCKYKEISWNHYPFKALDQLKRDRFLNQPEDHKEKEYEDYFLLTESGRTKAQELLKEYGLSDKELTERFEFREILPEEDDQAALIEEICFPPNEACSEKMMKERVAKAPELFLVAVDRETGKIAGFLNGLSTEEDFFRDEFFMDAELYDPDGKNVMLLGLDVLPDYQGQGLGREIMFQYLRRECERGRKSVILTCLESKVKMYEKMGFKNKGLSGSSWGEEQWYEMGYELNQ